METIIRKAIIISGMTAILAACLPENSTATVSPTNSLAAFIQKIAFVSARDGNDEIYIMNSDGSEQTNLSNSPANEWFPSWSPDGNKILFMSDRTGHFEIYVMNADGSDQVQLTNTGTENSSPAWAHETKNPCDESFPLCLINSSFAGPHRGDAAILK